MDHLRFDADSAINCAVTFSHKRNKKLQGVNLQYKKIYWPEEKRWIRLRVSTKVRLSQAISSTLCTSDTSGHQSSRDSTSRLGLEVILLLLHASSWLSPFGKPPCRRRMSRQKFANSLT